MPHDFGDFKVHRRYRGVNYEVEVITNGAEKGVREMTVDGARVEGTVIPYEPGKKDVKVTVVMG